MNIFRLPVIVGTLPVTLTNGTTADATQVMTDLNWLVNQVNANAAPLSGVALLASANTFTQVQSGVSATAPANFPIATQVQNWAFNTLSSTLGTNSITSRVIGMTLPAYGAGQVFNFLPSQPNTGPVTMAIDGLAARDVFAMGSALAGYEFTPGVPAQLVDDGTRLNLVSVRKIGTVLVNTMTSSVALATVGSFFVGPRVSQGSRGIWLATGGVAFADGAGAANFRARLTDGTTVAAEAAASTHSPNFFQSVQLSGVFSFPAGDIRIEGRDVSSGSGSILFDLGASDKDSTITVVRIG